MKELLHFSATWCQPCKAMEPTIAKFISNNVNVNYRKLDADINVEMFQEYGITGVPAFIAIKDGEVIASHKGIATEEKLGSLFS
jgi:thioredoxin 1